MQGKSEQKQIVSAVHPISFRIGVWKHQEVPRVDAVRGIETVNVSSHRGGPTSGLQNPEKSVATSDAEESTTRTGNSEPGTLHTQVPRIPVFEALKENIVEVAWTSHSVIRQISDSEAGIES